MHQKTEPIVHGWRNRLEGRFVTDEPIRQAVHGRGIGALCLGHE
jgi:hypothetical protein